MVKKILKVLDKNQIRFKKLVVCIITMALILQSLVYYGQNYTLDARATETMGNSNSISATTSGDAQVTPLNSTGADSTQEDSSETDSTAETGNDSLANEDATTDGDAKADDSETDTTPDDNAGTSDDNLEADLTPEDGLGTEPENSLQNNGTTEDGEPSADENSTAVVADGGITIYFDTSGNNDSTNGWKWESSMYIYLIYTDGTDAGLQPMTRSDGSKFKDAPTTTGTALWEYKISATDYAKCTGVIFSPYSTWQTGNATKTKDLYFANYPSFTTYAYPCFKLDGGYVQGVGSKTAECRGLELNSQQGKTIKFVNMTPSSLTGVTAHFGGEGLSQVAKTLTESSNKLYYQTTIPADVTNADGSTSPYQTVYFQDGSGTKLGPTYNFLSTPASDEVAFSYAEGSTDTFYYGVTEKADGTQIHTWGSEPSAANDSLKSKVLYFDKLFFNAKKTWKLQIGDEAPVTLTADANDSNTLSYTFASDATATQQTLLTLIAADGTQYHFKWSDLGRNKVTLNNNVANVTETYTKTYTVYFDATLSKLSYAGSGVSADATMPISGETICYHAWNTSTDVVDGVMTKMSAFSSDGNTWSDVYKAELSRKYTYIIFYSSNVAGTWPGEAKISSQTVDLTIPTNLENPCFYADTSDDAVYNISKGQKREGYWSEVYTIRDAEQGKAVYDTTTGEITNPVVDIDKSATKEPRTASNKYLQATFYDFYTDYELNGNNRDNYDNGTYSVGSHRIYQPFRQFNQALSSYYKANNASSPLYWGNFQNYDGSHFSEISSTLSLFGSDNATKLFYENNSMWSSTGGEMTSTSGKNATLGLVADELDSNDNLMIKTGSGTVAAPFFDTEFLSGNNDKNTVLGKVYESVSFPFTKKPLKSESDTSATGTVDYWVFDSADASTNLRMKQTKSGDYYLDNSAAVVKGQTAEQGFPATANGNFFPFNGSGQSGNSTKLNYGFAAKLEFKFRLTSDGMVTTTAGENEKVPIEFNFSGDDDVWIFIDGKLALDIGGGHGVVTGRLNFKDDTYYLSAAKDDGKSRTGSFTYREGSSKTDEHTLTMFYMERGLWESNMKVTYNFPDENQLEVEKQVDKTDVNDIFKECFDNNAVFTYHIRNLATHYAANESTADDDTEDEVVVDPITLNLSEFTPAPVRGTDNIFEFTNSAKTTIKWQALLDDKTGEWRKYRYGSIKKTNGTLDISQMKYLQFKFKYNYTDIPALPYMYLYLVDLDGKTKGANEVLSGKTYGSVPMKNNAWVTVKIDLEKLTAETGFDATNLKEIRFGYDFSREILLTDFKFTPATSASVLTGFTTLQKDISDYGSATSGKLEIPKGAKFTSSKGGNYAIEEDGLFVLENGESVVFRDQFRRGSYIALWEDESLEKLFDTTWTMYEDGIPVTEMSEGEAGIADDAHNVILDSSITSLVNIPGRIINDGRAERYKLATDADGYPLANGGYTETKRPAVEELEGAQSTIVFRSYALPDSDTTGLVTKLKVVFKNKAKVGSLIIKKDKAYSQDDLKGTYTFKVTFSNIGGLALEHTPIVTTVKLRYDEEYEIKGIPLGTYYEIEEITPTDGSTLDSVIVPDADKYDAIADLETKIVKGRISRETGDGVTPATITFVNTNKPVVDVSLTKEWKSEVTGEAITDHPNSIWVQLQRKEDVSADSTYAAVLGYEKIEIQPRQVEVDGKLTVQWTYSITGLDRVKDYENGGTTAWLYRFVELNPSKLGDEYADSKYADAVIGQDGKLVFASDNMSQAFKASYNTTYTAPETETDIGKFNTTITNKLLGPANLKVIKVSSDTNERLAGVTFTLEKQTGTSEDGEATWDTAVSGTTSALNTDANGVQTGGEVTFSDLEDGTYRLTETKSAYGHTLLKEPIIITINRKTDEYTWRMKSETTASELPVDDVWNEDSRTLSITVSNSQNIVLPHTGGYSPIPIMAGGMALCIAASLLYIDKRKRRRKEGEPPGT